MMFVKFEKKFGDGDLINALSAIQLSNYKFSAVQDLSKAELVALEALVIKIGLEIMQSDDVRLFCDAKNDYIDIIKKMHKLPFIIYATQLIQYYQLWCDVGSSYENSLQELHVILSNKKFVNPDKNLFIIEHQILTIYNELLSLENSIIHEEIPIEKTKNTLDLINSYLENSALTVNAAKIDAPYNIFMFYLGYAINRCYVKALEIEHILNSTVEEQLATNNLINYYSDLAAGDLNQITFIESECMQFGGSYPKGLEFSFGQHMFKQFAVIQEYVSNESSVSAKL